jgi:hypothetical protein
MAYKQKGCTPITAKLKKTTKGGMVQQPLLNMGAPVKMKSPAKQTVGNDTKTKQQAFKNEMSKQNKARADELAASKAAKKAKDIASYNSMMDKYRSNVSSLSADIKNASKSFGKNDYSMRAAARKAKEIAATENKLYNYDKKHKPGSTEGYTAKEYAMAKASGTYASKAKQKQKNLNARKEGEAGWAADDLARKNQTGQYAEKKKTKVTGKIGSELRRKQYDKLGWAYDNTIKARPKAKALIPEVVTAKVADVVKESKIITPNNNAKVLDKKTIKKVGRKTKSAEKKESRAARVRQKGIEALKSGNKQKALRLKRREERINKRAAKKRGQAAKAINPDK